MERHLPTVTQHILSLVSHPKATPTHIDAVYSRKCVNFILRSVFGQLLGESAQYLAAKQLCQLIIQTVTSGGGGGGGLPQSSRAQRSDGGDEGGVGGRDEGGGAMGGGRERTASQLQTQQQQHVVICAILEVGALVFNLNTAALPLVASDSGGGGGGDSQQDPPLFTALNHTLRMPQLAARLAGAWCLHCVSLALPSQLCTLVSHCLAQLQDPRLTQGGVSGYCYATSALLGTVRCSELGIPSAKSNEVLTLGTELVEKGVKMREGDKVALTYIDGGWALIGGFISLGEFLEVGLSLMQRSTVKACLIRPQTLWCELVA